MPRLSAEDHKIHRMHDRILRNWQHIKIGRDQFDLWSDCAILEPTTMAAALQSAQLLAPLLCLCLLALIAQLTHGQSCTMGDGQKRDCGYVGIDQQVRPQSQPWTA